MSYAPKTTIFDDRSILYVRKLIAYSNFYNLIATNKHSRSLLLYSFLLDLQNCILLTPNYKKVVKRKQSRVIY